MNARSAVVLFVALAAACSRTPTREWRASDHAQPPGVAESSAPPATASPEGARARVGAALYLANCASCHGARGMGDGPAAPPAFALPDFSAGAYQSARSDAQLAEAIANGRGAMPAFGQRFDDAGIAALVLHVRSLGAAQPAR